MRCTPLMLACVALVAADQPRSKAKAKPAVAGYQTTASGLKWMDLKAGKGESPRKGQACRMLYRGWLYENGQKGRLFDESQNPFEPFVFPVGLGRVIPGWDETVLTMKPGGKRVIILPSHLAYGDRGAPPDIPPKATLIFEVELLGFK